MMTRRLLCIFAVLVFVKPAASQDTQALCGTGEKAESFLDTAVDFIDKAKRGMPNYVRFQLISDRRLPEHPSPLSHIVAPIRRLGLDVTFPDLPADLTEVLRQSYHATNVNSIDVRFQLISDRRLPEHPSPLSHIVAPIRRLGLDVTFPDLPADLTEVLRQSYHATNVNSIGETSRCRMKPVDCEELLQCGNNKSGVYTIWPRNKIVVGSVEVYCDMTTDQGGWTVFQRRGNYGRPNDYFFKVWTEYKKGFGNIERDFWLGNDLIFALTNQRLYSMRIDLRDVEGNQRFALYDTFWIDGENEQYKLHVKDYSGDATDSLINWHDNQKFSTKDKDNDNNEENCAQTYKGAWWYNTCHASNLNGLYLRGKHDSFADGVTWSMWKGQKESMDITTMKIRPKNFHKNVPYKTLP